MRYAYVENGEIKEGPRGIPISWKNISGLHHLPQNELIALGWLPWRLVEVSSPGNDWVQTNPTIEIKENEIIETQTYREKTQQEKEEELLQKLEQARQNRAEAYRVEADPLFFKWQRDESTKEEWENKVIEIRERFPYPEND